MTTDFVLDTLIQDRFDQVWCVPVWPLRVAPLDARWIGVEPVADTVGPQVVRKIWDARDLGVQHPIGRTAPIQKEVADSRPRDRDIKLIAQVENRGYVAPALACPLSRVSERIFDTPRVAPGPGKLEVRRD